MRVSHGCVRLYPENIEFFYTLFNIGESVTIMNEPYQMGWKDGVLYFEAHRPLADDTVSAEERMQKLLDAQVDAEGQALNDHLRAHVIALSKVPSGVPVNIFQYDANEVMARARVVHNTVVEDPSEYTLSEVREMMDQLEAGAEDEAL